MAPRRSVGRALPLLLLAVVGIGCFGPSGVSNLAQVNVSFDEEDTSSGGLKSIVENNAYKLALLSYLVCFLVAKREPPPPKDPVQAGPLEKRGDYNTVLWMSAWLSLLSGIVNAVAIIEMGGTVAHHTGNASHAGRLAGTDGARFLALMVAYLAGAGVQGYCKSDGEALFSGRYSPGLLSASIAVLAGAVIHYCSGNALVALPLLSFSQGLQNAISRKCSSLPVCTTHMTGYLTDAGAGLGVWAASRFREPLSTRTKFFLLSISTFVAGGLAAKVMRDVVGVMAALVPAGLMAVTALGLIPLPKAVGAKAS
mmetsp:Transcript_68411/g.203514  ORF Transcript_68411/g.203514 Transcript_68411/m.203514 type:complete len:311 (+) Transcript_68411:68-1000(+)